MLLKNMSFLNANKAAGMNRIPAKFVQETAEILAYPLSKMTNLSVKLFVLPEKYKQIQNHYLRKAQGSV